MIVKLPNTRLAFANSIFVAKSVNGGEPTHSCSFIINPDTKAGKKLIAEVEAAMDEVAEAKWGEKAEGIMKTLRKKDKVCLRDGDDKAEYDGFAGNMYVSASNKTRPLIVDRDRSELSSSDGKPYGGCYVHGSIEIWAQDNDFGKRINASLRGIQFYKDGDAFAGGGSADVDEFDDLGDHGEDEDDLA